MKSVICMICMICLLPISIAARAGTCEQDFQAVGDPRNGLNVSGSVTKPGLSVASALGQLQKIGGDAGYQIGAESIEAGTLFLIQTNMRPNIIVQASANKSGTVSLGTKLPAGMKISADEARAEICGMLGKLKAGSEGEQVAKTARAKSGAGQVIDVKAEDLSAELKKEVGRAERSTVSGKAMLKDLLLGTSTQASQAQMNAATAPIVAKYMGRKYRIDGEVAGTSWNQYNDDLTVMYLVTQRRGLLGVRESASSSFHTGFSINCIMAPDEIEFFTTLAQGSFAKLTGTVSRISQNSMELTGCRQAK